MSLCFLSGLTSENHLNVISVYLHSNTWRVMVFTLCCFTCIALQSCLQPHLSGNTPLNQTSTLARPTLSRREQRSFLNSMCVASNPAASSIHPLPRWDNTVIGIYFVVQMVLANFSESFTNKKRKRLLKSTNANPSSRCSTKSEKKNPTGVTES